MTLTFEFAGQTHRGCVRKKNEDRWYADPDKGIYLVADGMGGAFGGGLASRLVVDVLPPLLAEQLRGIEQLNSDQALQATFSAIQLLSSQLRDESRGIPGVEGLGSTVVLVLVRDATALVAHLGDSRAYLFREGILERLTSDHTIVQVLRDAGEITIDEATNHPARGQLTRFVGMPGETLPEGKVVELLSGDCILLCSDGLTGMLDDEQIGSELLRRRSPKSICRHLIAAANKAGGKDNVTVVGIKVTVG